MVKKNQWVIKEPDIKRPIFGGKLAPDILDVKLFTDGMA
jgi:hypothetical protein